MSVLVGYIPTPEGEAAVEHAVEEARRRGVPLVVLNVRRDDIPSDPRKMYDEQAARLHAKLTAHGLSFEIVERERPRKAADEILAAIDTHAPELVVLGLRRRSAVGKLVLGSTAQRVLLEADCPVLAVKVAG